MITVVATVLNEGESIRRLMDSLAAQTRQPDEVVIVDGGSRDNTVAVIEEYAGRLPLRVAAQPGANISQGRNAAVEMARGDIIAITDAGVRLDPDWLQRLVAPLEADPDLQVVSGFFVPDPRTPFEIAMGATVLPRVDEIDPEKFLPSSRSVALRRAAFAAVGGYPEWLDYCEDLIFDFNLRDAFGRFGWAPGAAVYFRPRANLRAFFRQYYRYARGDGKADLWRRRHLIRYLTYLCAGPLLLYLGARHTWWWWALLILGAAAMFQRPYRRLLREYSLRTVIRVGWWVPVIRVTGDIAKMFGYPAGLLWRRRASPPPWRAGKGE
ncbi:MAG: glycosyltransferase [Anaerolineae bacterium]|nr:glycosyltransferase [Anaerolineae bacterium]